MHLARQPCTQGWVAKLHHLVGGLHLGLQPAGHVQRAGLQSAALVHHCRTDVQHQQLVYPPQHLLQRHQLGWHVLDDFAAAGLQVSAQLPPVQQHLQAILQVHGAGVRRKHYLTGYLTEYRQPLHNMGSAAQMPVSGCLAAGCSALSDSKSACRCSLQACERAVLGSTGRSVASWTRRSRCAAMLSFVYQPSGHSCTARVCLARHRRAGVTALAPVPHAVESGVHSRRWPHEPALA